jgi:hypothetical protein
MAVPPDLPPGFSLRRPEPARGKQESIDNELIGDVVYGRTAAIVAGSAAGAIFGLLWAGLPLRERRGARAVRRNTS